MKIAVVGGGIAGRLCAWRLALSRQHAITLFAASPVSGEGTASYAAAGMLSPIAECEHAHHAMIYDYGMQSLTLWETWLPQLAADVFFARSGSVVVAHDNDSRELDRYRQVIERQGIDCQFNVFDQTLEPALNKQGWYFKDEAQIDTRGVLHALQDALDTLDVVCRYETYVSNIKPGVISVDGKTESYDYVIDCRGYSARDSFPDIRGVRGELLRVRAIDVALSHPVRLLHPRYPIYIVPRPHHEFLIGASEIEAEDDSPMSVRSCMELLNAAYSVHSGFAEARIEEMVVGLRPALNDNLPRIHIEDGLVAINGLFRHGYLLAPALVDKAVREIQ